MKPSGLPPVIRESVFLILGTGMLTYLTATESTNPLLIGAALTILGAPIAISLKRLSDGKPDIPPTPDQSSESSRSSTS